MASPVRARVKPALLIWARESAGYTIEDAAARASVSDDRLRAWEDGDQLPTVPQLRTLADVYKRPLAVFYLQDVPTTFMPMRDFRRLPGHGPRRFSPELTLEIREVEQRRELALSLLEDSGDPAPHFPLSAKLTDDAEAVGNKILALLKVTDSERLRWSSDTSGYTAFRGWRSSIEEIGVLVFQTARVTADEVSGFAIAEDILPAIVVTRKGTPVTRRTFSLLHEFVHLLLRRSGVSEFDIDAERPPEEKRIEVFCNHVAAATLMPKDAFLGEDLLRGQRPPRGEWADATIAALARAYCVSREAVVRRLLTFALTTATFYRKKRAQYLREFKELQERNAAEAKARNETLPVNPPRDTLTNFGRPLVQLILESYYQDRMSLSEVSGYLGIRTRHIPTLEQLFVSGG